MKTICCGTQGLARLGLIVLTFVALAPGVTLAQTGEISGRVLLVSEKPAEGVRVRLVERRLSTRTDAAGRFTFAGLPNGHYHVEANDPRFGAGVAHLTLEEGAHEELILRLSFEVHREEIIVSASPDSTMTGETFQPVAVFNETELATRMEPSLGETLESEVGISSTFFGAGASRPIIRGFGADRSRVLEDGIGTGDVSGLSPDHAVSVDPLSARRVEIVRGPATLMFGGGAIGGVVNVIDNRILESLPARPAEGSFSASYGSNADEWNGSLSFGVSLGTWALHVGGFARDAEDYEIPGPAERFPEEGEEVEDSGVLENSSLEAEGFTVGLSRPFARGFVGVSFSGMDTLYGVPGHAHHHEEEEDPIDLFAEEDEEVVRIDLEQRRFDVKARYDVDGEFVRTWKFRGGYTDYEHTELEGAEIGTLYETDGWETRLEGVHQRLGDLTGSFGLQASVSELNAVGEEAFIAPSDTGSLAAFVFEELDKGDWRFLFGGRYEYQKVESSILGERFDESFRGLSASLGAARELGSENVLTATLSRSVRLPVVEELYSFGEHAATRSFEVGNPNLDEEVSLGLDVGFRGRAGRVGFETHVFWNRIDDFIYERPAEIEGLDADVPVFAFTQDDADYRGFEASADIALIDRDRQRVSIELGTDYVRAERRSDGEALPFIPPWRVRGGVHYHGARFFGFAEAVWRDDQDRVFCEEGVDEEACETATEGYTLVNASIGYRLITGRLVHEFLLSGRNLSDRLARNHVSRLKDMVPMPGRNIVVSYRLDF